MSEEVLRLETYLENLRWLKIGKSAVRKAQEENRKKGVANVYSYQGKIYQELPNGELRLLEEK